MSQDDHHRMFSRSATKFHVQLTGEDGTQIDGTSQNVGFGGLLLTTEQTVPVDSSCSLTIELSEAILIEAKGKVIRVADDELVVSFSAVRETDLEHLDALIRYNSNEDGTLVEDEHDDSRANLGLY